MSYTATLKISGKTFSSKGGFIAEALQSLDSKKTKGNGILTITNGNKTQERIFPAAIINRLFNLSPTMREVALKQVISRFDL